MRNEYQKIWESYMAPEPNSEEAARFLGAKKKMQTTGVKVNDSPYASMSDLELQDQLEAIQTEIERRQKSRYSSEVDF